MSENTAARIEMIRAKVEAGKNSESELRSKIEDASAKEFLLGRASRALADIEQMLLPRAMEARNPSDVGMWLSAADFMVDFAANQVEYANSVFAKYGPQLRVVGR